jgi:hypothetical protein
VRTFHTSPGSQGGREQEGQDDRSVRGEVSRTRTGWSEEDPRFRTGKRVVPRHKVLQGHKASRCCRGRLPGLVSSWGVLGLPQHLGLYEQKAGLVRAASSTVRALAFRLQNRPVVQVSTLQPSPKSSSLQHQRRGTHSISRSTVRHLRSDSSHNPPRPRSVLLRSDQAYTSSDLQDSERHSEPLCLSSLLQFRRFTPAPGFCARTPTSSRHQGNPSLRPSFAFVSRHPDTRASIV